MEENVSDRSVEPNISTERPWHRTAGGKIFLTLLGLLLLALLSFGGLVGYYLWQIKQGNGEDIAAALRSSKFTSDTAGQIASAGTTLPTDANQLIRPHNPTLGDATAPITVIMFLDFECPFCQEAYPTFQSLREQYEPVARFVFKHVPLSAIHPNSRLAHLAAACAEEQDQFWPYFDRLFTEKKLDRDSLNRYAEDLSLDLPQFTDCVQTEKYRANLDEDLADAGTIGIRGTPTYVVNQRKIEGAIDRAAWDTVLLEALSEAKP